MLHSLAEMVELTLVCIGVKSGGAGGSGPP